MKTGTTTIVRLGENDIQPAARILAAAFQEHSLFKYFIPDKSKRINKLHYAFEKAVLYGVKYGEVYATSSALEGITILLPSETADMTLQRLIRVSMFSLIFRLDAKFLIRGLRVNDFLSKVQRRQVQSRHWLLQFLGVSPDYQGKGYAGKLMKALLEKLYRENMPCYLETEEEETVPLYQRYGFKVVEESVIPRTDIKLWAMLREEPISNIHK
jgi:ribosomal protein S18 acetylase RimI-like enzyme